MPRCSRYGLLLAQGQCVGPHAVCEVPTFLSNGFKGLSVSALLSLFIASVFVWQEGFVF